MIFIHGNDAFYDDEKMLFYCHVGVNDSNMSLQYTAYGKTKEEAIQRAVSLTYILNSLDKGMERLAKQN